MINFLSCNLTGDLSEVRWWYLDEALYALFDKPWLKHLSEMILTMKIEGDDYSRKGVKLSVRASVRKGEIILLSNNRIGISRYYTGYYIIHVCVVGKEAIITHKTSALHAFIIKKNRDREARKRRLERGVKHTKQALVVSPTLASVIDNVTNN